MRIQAYTAYSGTLMVTIATPRPEQVASTHFTAATIHEDYCARVRAVLKEHKHIGATSLAYPAAQRLQNYFPIYPATTGNPLYAIRELAPAGSPRSVDPQWMLEIMQVRYRFALHILPPAFMANEVDAEGIERALEYAVKKLFQANSVPDVFIPGDNDLRLNTRSEIDILCELGPATERSGVDIPPPS